MDTGAHITITRPGRPGWLLVTVERHGRERRLWLADDDAAQLVALLTRELPAVTVTSGPA